MTAPTDPQAAIDRLRATLPGLTTGHITAALLPAYGQYENYIEASVAFAADIETLTSLTQALVEEPTDAMADAGMHCNSEWLNDAAPLGERRYREPAMAVWRTMWRVAANQDPDFGWKAPS